MILLHVKIGTAYYLIAATGYHADIIICLGVTSFFILLYIYIYHSIETCGWISLKLGMMIGFDPT